MATTSNFSWATPDDSASVKDGASAIRSLGTAIDTALVDLKGGTTGQTLTKATNTDMDFAWATPAAAGGMTLISTTSLSGELTNITSIPSGYKSLLLRVLGAYGTNAGTLQFRFNNDSGNPSYVTTNDSYSTSLSVSGLGGTWMFGGTCYNGSIGSTNIVEMYIPNYTSTTQKKAAYTYNATRSNDSNNISLGFRQNYWDNTSAITQINIGGFSSFAAGTALLYGVN
jgi:hypothetical protein